MNIELGQQGTNEWGQPANMTISYHFSTTIKRCCASLNYDSVVVNTHEATPSGRNYPRMDLSRTLQTTARLLSILCRVHRGALTVLHGNSMGKAHNLEHSSLIQKQFTVLSKLLLPIPSINWSQTRPFLLNWYCSFFCLFYRRISGGVVND